MKNRTFFPYFGGKALLAKDLIPLFPEHHCYVEVFGGAGNVLLQKHPSKVEIYNDINTDVVNLFRQVRDNRDAFVEKVKLYPASRSEFHEHIATLADTDLDPLDRAVLWYIVAQQSFSGHWGSSWTVGSRRNHAAIFKQKVEDLPLITDRLRGVKIEHKDYQFIIDTYDKDDTLFYLDPPYLPETRSAGEYKHEMSRDDHEYLLFLLRSIKGKFVLSGYPNELYDAEGWHTKEFETVCWAAGKTRAIGLQGEGKV